MDTGNFYGITSHTYGNNGDLYYRTDENILYRKYNDAWHVENAFGNVTTGDVAPDNATGDDGDQYINIATGDFYRKDAGVWELESNLLDQFNRFGYWFSAFTNLVGIPESFETVEIVGNVTEIKAGTFAYCEYLKEVILPDSVTTIGDHAFEYCTSLKSVDMPSSLNFVGDYAFYCCVGLENVEFCGLIDRIGEYAFSSCYSLSSLSLDVRVIGEGAFDGCVNLLQVYLIQDYLTEIGDGAFCSCQLLTSVIFATRLSIHPASCTIGEEAFRGCVTLQYINFCGSVITSIGQSAFSNCSSLTFISFNDGLTSIGANAFESCYGLAAIRLPSSVASIGENAFKDCYSLRTVLYGASSDTAWNAITINSGNDYLTSATRKYNA